MHIVLDGEGKGEVDDVIDVRNVEAARRHVCRHQQRDLSALEILHRQGPAINNRLTILDFTDWRSPILIEQARSHAKVRAVLQIQG